MNERREANDEEVMGESENGGDDVLDLEEVFTNSLLGHQSEVDGTTIVGEDSGKLPPRTTIYWASPPVKTQLSEPEFDTVNNPGQWSEFTFRPAFVKVGGMYKRHALSTGVMPLPQYSSGKIRINGWEFH